MLASYFTEIRAVHIAAVVLSGTLFLIRGVLRLARIGTVNTLALRVGSVVIDTVLLLAAVLLTLILHQYPFVNGWLSMKLALLLLYIAAGSVALKRGRERLTQASALAVALLTYLWIIGVALTHSPSGWWSLLRASS